MVFVPPKQKFSAALGNILSILESFPVSGFQVCPVGTKAFSFGNSTESPEKFSFRRKALSITTLKPYFSLTRPNRGFKEFRDKDRAVIVRFPQDDTFVTLDYKSQSIVG